MIITVYESVKPNKVLIESKRDEFIQRYGKMLVEIPAKELVREMQVIARWANNELKEECLFEIG